MKKSDKIYVAGHSGMVGSGIMRYLLKNKFTNIITASKVELDLRNQNDVNVFFQNRKPDYVFLAASKVGGIQANLNSPAEFLYDNLLIQNNVIQESNLKKVKKVVFFGSSCIYPRDCPQPMKEEYLMSGPLEPTNEGYAFSKITGLKMMQYYKVQYGLDCLNVMPCNLYGTNDHYDPTNSHVLSALIKKFTDAVDDGKKEVILWGSGKAKREFMHVDDLVEAIFFLMEKWPSSEIINVGTGVDLTIKELAGLIATKVGFQGTIKWDLSKPDGMLLKCLDISKLESLGFKAKISLEEGIIKTISEYKSLKQRNEVK